MERDVIVEEEIDLRQYVLVLFRKRWLIIGLTILVAAVAYVQSARQPKIYEATANLVMYRLRPEIIFAPEFKTIMEAGGTGGQTRSERIKGLVELAKSSAIANSVVTKIGESLTKEEKEPGALIGMIEGKTEGDIIKISVLNEDPAKAALIANMWAVEYENHVNGVYSPAATEELLDSTSGEFKKAKQRYDMAEKKLSDFLSTNSADVCSRMLKEKGNIVKILSQAKGKSFSVTVNELIGYYTKRKRLGGLLRNAKALAQQIEADGGASSGTAFALILLEQKTYAGEETAQLRTSEQENMWQLDLSSLMESGEVKQRKEVAALVQALEKHIAELDTAIAETLPTSPPPEAGVVARPNRETWLEKVLNRKDTEDIESAIKKVEDEIAELTGELERQQALRKELARARDQAWEIYKTLAKKIDELHIMKQVGGTEVKLAAEAVVPKNPVSPKTRKNVGLAAVVGFMISCFLAFFIEFVSAMPKEQRV